jgi:two-component system, sensor histidine kinase and response regulator
VTRLLVEDNEINQELAGQLLRDVGMLVSIAHSGREAVEKVAAEPFDGVLMDIQMPDMDGYQAARIIRAEPEFGSLPIIAMTANAMPADRAKALAAGMNEHVSKPVDPSELYAAIRRWFKPRLQAATLPPATPALTISPRETPVENLDGVDVSDGLKRVAGNRTLHRNLLLKFRQSQERAAEDIRAALAAGDRQRAERIAHTVRGVAGNIGAKELQAAAATIETHLQQPDSPFPDLSVFETALRRVISSIASFSPPIPRVRCDNRFATAPRSSQSLPISNRYLGTTILMPGMSLRSCFHIFNTANMPGFSKHYEKR